MVRGDALAHPRLDRGQVVRRQRARQEQVVVEAVVDDRPDPELRAREQVHHRLGQDVGGRVAHRAELAARAVIHQLGGRPALGRVEPDLVALDPGLGSAPRPVPGSSIDLLRITKPLVHRQDERLPPAVPPAFAPCVAHSWSR